MEDVLRKLRISYSVGKSITVFKHSHSAYAILFYNSITFLVLYFFLVSWK